MSIVLFAVIDYHQNPDFLTLQVLDFGLILTADVNPDILARHLGYAALKVDYAVHKGPFKHFFIKLS
jgi:hypothetical protein